ncbi:MAG: hypothetical protein IPM98_15635 [Lewinellaceae bacterium]|nr:hypothetical protein [Lewinellaceae bacterium]
MTKPWTKFYSFKKIERRKHEKAISEQIEQLLDRLMALSPDNVEAFFLTNGNLLSKACHQSPPKHWHLKNSGNVRLTIFRESHRTFLRCLMSPLKNLSRNFKGWCLQENLSRPTKKSCGCHIERVFANPKVLKIKSAAA